LALFGHAAVVAECPLLRDELTKLRRGLRSEFDPTPCMTRFATAGIIEVAREVDANDPGRVKDGTIPFRADRSSRGSSPREFSSMQLDEVVHAYRLLACELEMVGGHTVVAALLIQLRHHGEVLDKVRREAAEKNAN